MCKFGFCKVFGHIFFKATADIRLRVMKFFQNFGNGIGKVIRILQKTCKTLDPGRSGVLQLRVLRKEEKKDIGDNVFIQKILKSSIFFRDRIESIELMFKKFNYFGSQSNFERGAGIYNRIIIDGYSYGGSGQRSFGRTKYRGSFYPGFFGRSSGVLCGSGFIRVCYVQQYGASYGSLVVFEAYRKR